MKNNSVSDICYTFYQILHVIRFTDLKKFVFSSSNIQFYNRQESLLSYSDATHLSSSSSVHLFKDFDDSTDFYSPSSLDSLPKIGKFS